MPTPTPTRAQANTGTREGLRSKAAIPILLRIAAAVDATVADVRVLESDAAPRFTTTTCPAEAGCKNSAVIVPTKNPSTAPTKRPATAIRLLRFTDQDVHTAAMAPPKMPAVFASALSAMT